MQAMQAEVASTTCMICPIAPVRNWCYLSSRIYLYGA